MTSRKTGLLRKGLLISGTVCLLVTFKTGAAHAQEIPPQGQFHITIESAAPEHRTRESFQIHAAVYDELDRPVPGATVSFDAPAKGPGLIFENDGKTRTTNEMGTAIVDVRANDVGGGPYTIRVTAKFEGKTDSIPFMHTNRKPPWFRSRTGKAVLVVGSASAASLITVLTTRPDPLPAATIAKSKVNSSGPVGAPKDGSSGNGIATDGKP